MRTHFREQVCIVGLIVTLIAFFILHYSQWGMVRYRRSVAIMGIKHRKRHHGKHPVHDAVHRDHNRLMAHLKNSKKVGLRDAYRKSRVEAVGIARRKLPHEHQKTRLHSDILKYRPNKPDDVRKIDSDRYVGGGAVQKAMNDAFVKHSDRVKHNHVIPKRADVWKVKKKDVLKFHPENVNARRRITAPREYGRKMFTVHAHIGGLENHDLKRNKIEKTAEQANVAKVNHDKASQSKRRQ